MNSSGPSLVTDLDQAVAESFRDGFRFGVDLQLLVDSLEVKRDRRGRNAPGGPAPTLDGRYIIFHSFRAGKINIWRMDIDGNNPRQLTNSGRDVQPHSSPDGKWVFYVSTREGGWMLYKVPIDGGEPIRLFDKSCAYPSVSPDGKLVALTYKVDEPVGGRRVAVISSETGQQLKTFDLGSYWNLLRWTPDGRAVAYIDNQGDVSNIWAQPLDGGKPVQLTDFKSEKIFNFAWSNDGKQLALARGSETSDIVLIRDSR